MKPDRIVVTGANGQLGKCLKDVAAQQFSSNRKMDFLFEDKLSLDITNEDLLQSYFKTHQPSYIINCAAYTAVDKAETEQELAFAINEQGVKNLIETAKSYQTKIIHISTDYVFEGDGTEPYIPEDKINPQGAYGLSKAKGEQAILSDYKAAVIIRTSWVYSEYGHNFFKTMHKLSKEKEQLNIVNDQVGCPTYAGDLAYAILQIINTKQNWSQPEIYHFANCGKITWYSFAKKIMELSGSNCKINGIPSSEYPTPAKRPAFSLLSTEKIAKAFGLSIPFWEDSLRKCFSKFIELQKIDL